MTASSARRLSPRPAPIEAPEPDPTPNACANCSTQFTPKSTLNLFCTATCKTEFYNIHTVRGRVLLPLLLTAATRRYDGDKALTAYARKQADALISRWLVEDRACGRRSELMVAGKMGRLWVAADLA